MQLEYDEEKRRLTLERRGLDFRDAGEVFVGPAITLRDDRRDYGEPRFQTLGPLRGEIVMVVWTPRATARRVMSMRKCDAKERANYFHQLGRSG